MHGKHEIDIRLLCHSISNELSGSVATTVAAAAPVTVTMATKTLIYNTLWQQQWQRQRIRIDKNASGTNVQQ